MTKKVDVDALIAEARAWTREDADAAPRNLRRLARSLADALEQPQAELRQERADEGWRVAGEQTRLERERAENAEAALSRAEETIEKVRNRYHRYASQEEQTYDEEVDALQDIAAILTEYDKQKSTPVESRS